jgi:hypothetical protein
MVSTGDKLAALQFLPPSSNFDIALLNADISFVTARALPEPIELNAQELSSHLQARFAGQVLTAGQQVPFEYVVSAGRQCASFASFAEAILLCRRVQDVPLTAVAACSVQPLGRTTLLQNDVEEAAASSTTSLACVLAAPPPPMCRARSMCCV